MTALSSREQVEQAVAPYSDARPRSCTVVRRGRITWHCSGCGEPIRGKSGSLTVPELAALAWREADKDALDRAAGPDRRRAFVMSDYDQPPRPRWLAYHLDCHPTGTRAAYGFGTDEVATPLDVMTWTAHLLETKDWLPSTDWHSLLYLVAAAMKGPPPTR
jgi:hypothetical protein